MKRPVHLHIDELVLEGVAESPELLASIERELSIELSHLSTAGAITSEAHLGLAVSQALSRSIHKSGRGSL